MRDLRLGVALAGLVAAALPSPGLTRAPSPPASRPHGTKNYLPDMTWPEVAALRERTDMAIVPLTALEQHGRSGPIGTDFYNAVEKAKRIARRTDVLVVPILLPGNSPYHMEFPGTITLSAQTIQQVYFEAAQSLLKHGFKRILFLNGHGGNAAITKFVVDRVNQETAGIAVDLGEAASPFRKREAADERFDRHAGVGETSESLYLTPGLVDQPVAAAAPLTMPPHLQRLVPKVVAGDKTAELVLLAEALKAKSTGKQTSTREMTATGNWTEADMATASAEKGRETVEDFVDAAVQFIDTWKTLRPAEPAAH